MSSLLSYGLIMINPDLPSPPYQQVADILRRRIEAGDITGRLPSETTLAQEFELSKNTIRRALGLLRDEGLLVTIQGYGTFVRPGTGAVSGELGGTAGTSSPDCAQLARCPAASSYLAIRPPSGTAPPAEADGAFRFTTASACGG